jgi:Family of unknown function (DUF6523)
MPKFVVLICLLLPFGSIGFSPLLTRVSKHSICSKELTFPLGMAGFASASSDGSKKKKEIKLKPKQQWDRYTNLKKETSFLVAVRVVGEEDWLEVGRVKAKDNLQVEMAVAKQRVIIAEHSRRLFPLQIPKDSKVEWAIRQTEPEEKWILVDKSVLDTAPDGLEKDVGFEGRPDPASGFYCLYNRGRLVDGSAAKEGRV